MERPLSVPGLTITEKILAAHAGLAEARAGELVTCSVDLVMANDIMGPPAYEQMKRMGATAVFDASKVALVPSHYVPPASVQAAEMIEGLRGFAREQAVEHYFELGETGIEHALLPDEGLILPGSIIVGSDSHSTTYGALNCFSTGMGFTDIAAALALGETWLRVPETHRFDLVGTLGACVTGKDVILSIIGRYGTDGARYQAMEYGGPGMAELNMDDRLTITNMAVEAGGKNGVFEFDGVSEAYLRKRTQRPYTSVTPDSDAVYIKRETLDLSTLTPLVAAPFSPANTQPVQDAAGTRITQAFIGSCTNARLTDLRQAVSVLRGRRVHSGVRLIITPATQAIYNAALKEGLLQTLSDAGAMITAPGCGACAGLNMGVLSASDVCVSTTNRNFRGRMGHRESRTYLGNAYVAAASAVAGEIVDPRELVNA